MMTGRPDSDAARDHGRDGSARDLMLGYCRGEREAFDQMYAQLAPSILAALVAWTGDRRRAEDLLDRTFQVLHSCRSAYVEGADPEPWICQIARRELVLDDRKRTRDGRSRFWSGVRAAFTRSVPIGVEARS
jgi:DNA-directed RNA polymerase specialized sigma24 family protein